MLNRGEKGELRVGDMLQLVVEEKCPAVGPSLAYVDNACVYMLEAGPEKRSRGEADGAGGTANDVASDEVAPARGAVDDQCNEPRPPKVAKMVLPTDDVHTDAGGDGAAENCMPQHQAIFGGNGGSYDDPICL